MQGYDSQVVKGSCVPSYRSCGSCNGTDKGVLRIVFRPGSFYGDVLLVLDPDSPDGVRHQAVRRLAIKHLTLRYVYQASPGLQRRWSRVRPAFEAYCREHGLSYPRAWEQLVAPVICDLVLSTNERDVR
jgi:hypothetical protein